MMKKIGSIDPKSESRIAKEKDAWEYARFLGLGSLIRQRREHAEEIIRQMNSDTVPFLLAVIEEGKRRFARRKQRLRIGAFTRGSDSRYIRFFGSSRFRSNPNISVTLMLPMLSFMLALLTPSRLGNRAVLMLSDSGDDVAHVPPMLDAIGDMTGSAQKTVQAALTNLFPKITHNHGHLITEPMKVRLRDQLDGSRTYSYYGDEERADYIAAVIRFLAELGDERSYPIVKELAESLYLNGAGARIRQAAQSALPVLKQCYERAQVSNSLLRPSDTPTNDDTLV
jgi:hypothetical protein